MCCGTQVGVYLLYKYLEVEKVVLWLLLSPSFLHCHSGARLECNSAALFGVNSVALVLLQKKMCPMVR